MVISETTVNQFHVEEDDALGASGREPEITRNKASQRLPSSRAMIASSPLHPRLSREGSGQSLRFRLRPENRGRRSLAAAGQTIRDGSRDYTFGCHGHW
jgi:hypothetical protein